MIWPYYLEPGSELLKEQCVCEPCRPVVMHQEAVTCGWTIEATNVVAGSSAYNAVSCNSGQKFCFDGSTEITLSGLNPLILNSLIIYGHNMVDATISVSPHNFFGGATTIGTGDGCLCVDDECPPTFIRDIVIPPVGSEVDSVTISIQSEGIICIDRLILGRKLPIDYRASTYKNPFDGTDRETDVKESSCGPLVTSTRRVKVPLKLDLPCVPCEFGDDDWKCYLKWAHKHGFIFRPCINTQPNNVFIGTLDDKQPPSEFADASRCTKNLKINATGYITPPPCKISGATSTGGGNTGGGQCPDVRCLTIKKNVDPGPYQVGDQVNYQFIISNDGNVSETGIVISDPNLDNPIINVGTLGAGGSTVVSGIYTVTAADAGPGRVSNTAQLSSDSGQNDSDSAIILIDSDVTTNCDTVFDCDTSEQSFNFNNGTLAGMACGSQVPISLLWIGCDGTRPTVGNIGLSASIGSVQFNGSNPPNPLNNYLYTLPSTPGPHTVQFQWGNSADPQLCSVNITFDCEPIEGYNHPVIGDGGAAKIFPGAEGHGCDKTGGRGGQVIEVTNLNDSGGGSLRAALEASGTRLIIQKVSGHV